MDFATYERVVLDTRAKNELSQQRNQELLASKDGEQHNAGGSVAHISDFTLRDRQTGLEKKESSVTLATVAILNGKRILTELTEVYRSA